VEKGRKKGKEEAAFEKKRGGEGKKDGVAGKPSFSMVDSCCSVSQNRGAEERKGGRGKKRANKFAERGC